MFNKILKNEENLKTIRTKLDQMYNKNKNQMVLLANVDLNNLLPQFKETENYLLNLNRFEEKLINLKNGILKKVSF